MTDYQDESELLQKVATGDHKAFQILVQRMGGKVFGFCCRLMAERERGEEMTQETWMRVIEKSPTYSPNGSASSWILTIARNLCLNELRDFSKEVLEIESQESNLDKSPADSESAEELLVKFQNQSLLRRAIDELPEQQRVVLTIHLVEEISDAEIAQQLNLSISAVKSLLFRARENLSKKILRVDKP